MNHTLNLVAVGLFIVGLMLHTLAQIDAIARAKNNPAGSRLGILAARWIPIVVRGAICLAIFVLWLQGELADVATALKIPIPDTMDRVLDLHVGGSIAFVAGYAFDSALGYVPFLKSSIPPAIDAADT